MSKKSKQNQEEGQDQVSEETQDIQDAPDKQKSGKLQELEQQVASLTEDLQRERADFANYRRRSQADQQQARQQVKAELLADMLPVLDDLERALVYTPEDLQDHPWAEGIRKVHNNFRDKLRELGLEKMTTVNESFDPQLHEAVGYDDNGNTEEVIVEELRAGYLLDGEVLRPAMVRVGSDESGEQPLDEESGESVPVHEEATENEVDNNANDNEEKEDS